MNVTEAKGEVGKHRFYAHGDGQAPRVTLARTAAMRIASFNVENLFDRAKALKLDWEDGRVVLERYARLNQLVNKPLYSDEDKQEIKDLLRKLGLAKRDDGGRYAELRQVRGRLLTRRRGGGLEITATGRASWIGWVELKTAPECPCVAERRGAMAFDPRRSSRELTRPIPAAMATSEGRRGRSVRGGVRRPHTAAVAAGNDSAGSSALPPLCPRRFATHGRSRARSCGLGLKVRPGGQITRAQASGFLVEPAFRASRPLGDLGGSRVSGRQAGTGYGENDFPTHFSHRPRRGG
jgi:hypothetical protein